MVTGIYVKEKMTFIKSTPMEFDGADGKKVKGISLLFEDSNEVEGKFFIGESDMDVVSYPEKRCEGTLYIKVTETNKKPKISFKKFVPD